MEHNKHGGLGAVEFTLNSGIATRASLVFCAREVGIAENEAEAVKWYRKAADQGHTDAIEALKRRVL